MPTDTVSPARTIGGYDLLSKIAEGGMGAVYKARSHHTGDIVAIKIIPSDTAKNPVLMKRFEQEFRAASLLDHPNIVKAIEYCGTGTNPFLVMEFVDGLSLGRRVEKQGPYSEEAAIRILAQVCEGLHRAHKQGLIHRDVKPDNIIVTGDGVAKLTDLGLVKDVEGEQNLTKTGRGLGTLHFMAPEQFRNAKNADVRFDIYSLGATLYMMVTGVVPFAKTSPLDCWMKKIKNDFPAPKKHNPNLSDRVNWAILRAMSADPDKRPASCRELLEDLTGQSWQGWNTAKSDLSSGSSPPAPGIGELWYLVYKNAEGVSQKVKGTVLSIRENVKAGMIGDPAAIMVSRVKAGPYSPLRSVPEFRDLVVTAAAVDAGRASGKYVTPPNSVDTVRQEGTVPHNTPKRKPDPAAKVMTEEHTVNPIKSSKPYLKQMSKQKFDYVPWLLVIAVATVVAVGIYVFLR